MSIDFPLILNFFIAVVAILNPIGNVPVFLEHVNQDSTDVQKNIAKLLALSIFIICTFFFFIGQPFLSLFGISIPAFRIAGGILIMTIGFRMLHGKPKFENEGLETNASSVSAFKQATERLSSLIVPLAMPIFAGPGAIATVILYAQKPNNFLTMIGMVFALAAAFDPDELSSIVILTDGECRYPPESAANGVPVLWLINNETHTPPWGRLARISVG